MPGSSFSLPLYFDYGATFLWALSGGLYGAKRGYDVAGIAAIALVSSLGGGVLRDGVFLQNGPPAMIMTPAYLIIVSFATILVVGFGRRVDNWIWLDSAVQMADALGIGGYAVVGVSKALALNIPPYGAALIGIVNAVGGGMLRDTLTGEEPQIFKPGTLMALAALAGCVAYLALTLLARMDGQFAAWITIALCFVLRAASVRYKLITHAVRGVYEPSE